MVPPTRTNPTALVDDKSEEELNRIGSSFISESGFIPFEGNEKILIFKDDKLEENLKPAAQMLGLLKGVCNMYQKQDTAREIDI
jgi:hypothetical protein